jgi:hypothetical protein
LCGKPHRERGRLIIEIDEPPRKTHIEVCRRCTGLAVLEALARRAAGEGRTDDPRTADGANQNIDARTLGVAGAGIAAAQDKVAHRS